jgi:hypothetical protein
MLFFFSFFFISVLSFVFFFFAVLPLTDDMILCILVSLLLRT